MAIIDQVIHPPATGDLPYSRRHFAFVVQMSAASVQVIGPDYILMDDLKFSYTCYLLPQP